ncbi:MAG: hypothetical protein M3R27_01865 [Bacteroidota bacterium]|nr:hypothetical protein [Bacteroidota bacterium]
MRLKLLLISFVPFFLFFQIQAGMAQDEGLPSVSIDDDAPPRPKQYYLFSPRVSVTVPHPMGNKSFKKSFVGIYEVSGGLNIMFFKGLFIGGTFKNGLLKITENKIADYNARLSINNAAVKVGGDMFVGDKNRMIFSASVSVGKNWSKFSGIVCKTPGEKPMIDGYTTYYYEPEMNLFFLIESNFGIGATLSYSIFNKNFDPYELCLDDWTQFDKSNVGSTQYLSFGFGFYYSFLKKNK